MKAAKRSQMTIDRVTERLQEQKNREDNFDRRRFNSRSVMKESYQMNNIRKHMRAKRAKKRGGGRRAVFTEQELKEYNDINAQQRMFSEQMRQSRKKVRGIPDESGDRQDEKKEEEPSEPGSSAQIPETLSLISSLSLLPTTPTKERSKEDKNTPTGASVKTETPVAPSKVRAESILSSGGTRLRICRT